MVRRLLTALVVALLVSGAFTLVLARKLARPQAPSLRYVTAARDLDAGEVLKAEDVKLMSWPANASLSGAVLAQADAVGRAVLNPLAAGQPLLARELSPLGGVGLSAKIPDGMRAISLRSDQVVGVAGFLLPGTHTDVLVTYRNPAQTEAVTATVLQNAEVLAAGQKMQPDPDGKPSTVDVVTLLVSPQDAERVVLASTQGTVHFLLRNGADRKQSELAATDIAALGLAPKISAAEQAMVSRPATVPKRGSAAGQSGVKTIARAAAPEYRVVVVRGDKRTEETFQ